MEPYLFSGVVLPERAQLSLQYGVGFSHLGSNINGIAKVSIVLNQVAVWVESEHDWDPFDLRNVVRNIIQSQLAMVGYLKGYAYDLELSRVLCQSRGIDCVFGIDVPCIAEQGNTVNLQDALSTLREKTLGPDGVFLHRCFNDLIFAMKHADDTGFYCYRAIESLRHHCASLHGLSAADRSKQWKKFREFAGIEESTLLAIKSAADPLRHGNVSAVSSEDRAKLFSSTWAIVGAYLAVIPVSADGHLRPTSLERADELTPSPPSETPQATAPSTPETPG
jgi:hypothetical protein